MLSNYFVTPADVENIVIVETEKAAKEVLLTGKGKRLFEKVLSGFGRPIESLRDIDAWFVINSGKEVTKKLTNEYKETEGAQVKLLSLDRTPKKLTPFEDINEIASQLPETVKDIAIPKDIIEKAKVMSEVYLYTYCAENALRVFIVNIAQKHYGVDYLVGLKLNSKMKEKIAERKGLQEKRNGSA